MPQRRSLERAMPPAIQDLYPEKFSQCYGCGASRPDGLRLKSYVDGDETVARFTVGPRFSGGVPDHVYGGMVASLLDCHGAASAAAFAYRAAGHEIGDGGTPLRFVTASLKIDFLRPSPIEVELVLRGKLASIDDRKARVSLSLCAGDVVCATGEMVAVRFQE